MKDITKIYDKVWEYQVKSEREEKVSLFGIPFKIKRYKTTRNTSGIRVPLLENQHELFVKFNELLLEVEKYLSRNLKEIGLYDFTSFKKQDRKLDEVFGNIGFYVYRDHIIFNEEKGADSPYQRLKKFLKYYKEKFNIKTTFKETSFDVLDVLEVSD